MIRFFDLFCSIFGIILLAPLLLIIAILIKIDSKGPILFKQTRVGLKGTKFKIFKFRSMQLNSEQKGQLTVGNKDQRITNIGGILRAFKLDEIPQLFNVFLGQMSLVGPRPEVEKYVAHYTKAQRAVLNVKPGITDLASIHFINENALLAQQKDPEKYYIDHVLGQKIELNMPYVNHQSILLYFKIIFQTVFKILKLS